MLLLGGGAARTVSSSISAVLLMGNTSHCGVQSNFIPLTTAHPASQHQPFFLDQHFILYPITSSFSDISGNLSRVFNEMSVSGHLKKKESKIAGIFSGEAFYTISRIVALPTHFLRGSTQSSHTGVTVTTAEGKTGNDKYTSQALAE